VNLGDFQDRRGNLLRDAVRYNWLLIALFIILGAAAGVGASYAKPQKYTSSTTLLINPIVGNPYTPESNSDVLEMLQTEARGIDVEPSRVRQQTRVSVPPNTQALQIAYTSSTRLLAPQIVEKIAEIYLADREDQAQEVVDTRVSRAETEIAQARDLQNEALDETPPNRGLAKTYEARIDDAQQSLASAKALATDPGRVLTPGFVPAGGDAKHIITFGIAGGIAGTLAGVAIALWRERRRDLVRTASALDDYAFDAPVTAIHGHELDEDAVRHLRMRLAPQIKEHGVISLVGLAPGHAFSTGVLLASSLATSGTSVVLIDGTGTEPGHRDLLGFEGKPGLSQALTSHSPNPPTAYKVSKNFGYLPAGEGAAEASEHLVEDRARTVVLGVAERYDLTLVACMPLDNAEGEAMANLTEGVLLLVELNRTSHYELGMAVKTLNKQGHRLLGVFVLPPSR
jgi:Mrp family chromosome partitioning ATPase